MRTSDSLRRRGIKSSEACSTAWSVDVGTSPQVSLGGRKIGVLRGIYFNVFRLYGNEVIIASLNPATFLSPKR
jgi:hypothetical protein